MYWKMMSVALLLLLFCVGCGKEAEEETAENLAEKIIEQQSGGEVEVDLSGGSMSVKTADGEEMKVSSGDDLKAPEGFPKDVHVYEGGKIIVSMMMGANNFNLSLQTKDAQSKVVEVYKKQMGAEGWELEASMAVGEGEMLHFKKGERKTSVIVSAKDGLTTIVLTVQEKK